MLLNIIWKLFIRCHLFFISIFSLLIPGPLVQWSMKGKKLSFKNWGATLEMTNSWSCQTQDTAGWHQHCCWCCQWIQHVGKNFGCARRPPSAYRWVYEEKAIFCNFMWFLAYLKFQFFHVWKLSENNFQFLGNFLWREEVEPHNPTNSSLQTQPFCDFVTKLITSIKWTEMSVQGHFWRPKLLQKNWKLLV